MVAWWKFDKAEGRDVIDSSGNALNGKLIAGASIVEDPERGNVLNLNGDGEYVDCGSHRFFNITNEITVMAWIKLRALDKWWQPIVNKGESLWRLQRWHAHDVLEFGCTGVNVEGSQFGHLLKTVNINDGKWHHIAGVYDGTTVYLNVDGMCDTYERASDNLGVSDESVLIGGNLYIPGRTWNGMIDDVRIYSYALSEAEIKTIYAGKYY